MKKSFFAFVLAFTVLLGVSVFADTSIKVQNSGFEQLKTGKLSFWVQHAWDQASATFSFDNGISHSGKRSAIIVNKKTNDARYTQVIKVEPNTLYKLSCWVKTENIGAKEKGACIAVESVLDTSPDVKGTSDWKQVTLYGRTTSEQTMLTMTVGIGGYGTTNTGKAWFDDVTITKIDKTPSGVNVATLAQVSNNNNDQPPASTNNVNYLYIIAIIAIVIIIILVSFFINKNNKKTKKNDDETETDIYDQSSDEAKTEELGNEDQNEEVESKEAEVKEEDDKV